MQDRDLLMRSGLEKLYQSQILAVVSALCAILAIVPLLGAVVMVAVSIAGIVAVVLDIMGLLKLNKVDSKYTFVLLLNIASYLWGAFSSESLDFFISLAATWLLVKTTNVYLEQVGASAVVDKGNTLLKVTIGMAGLALILAVLAVFPLGGLSMAVMQISSAVSIFLSLAQLVLTISYLGSARDSF